MSGLIVDPFAGGGAASTGTEVTLGLPEDVAVDDPITEWCLVRWLAGGTKRCLLNRVAASPYLYPPGYAEELLRSYVLLRGMSFCGPLSPVKNRTGCGFLGFPRGEIGYVTIFETEDEATRFIEEDGSRLSIDVPTPIAVLSFWICIYRDGEREGSQEINHATAIADYEQTLGRATKLNMEEGFHIKVTLECRPLFERLGNHRPTEEQARRINALEEHLEAQRKDTSASAADLARQPLAVLHQTNETGSNHD